MNQYDLAGRWRAGRIPVDCDWLISPADVADQLVKIANGKMSFVLASAWPEGASGNVTIDTAEGWRIVVFNDGFGIDYVDSATAPDGRRQDSWRGSDDLAEWFDPYVLLSERPKGALLKRLRAWRQTAATPVAYIHRATSRPAAE